MTLYAGLGTVSSVSAASSEEESLWLSMEMLPPFPQGLKTLLLGRPIITLFGLNAWKSPELKKKWVCDRSHKISTVSRVLIQLCELN